MNPALETLYRYALASTHITLAAEDIADGQE